MRVLLADDDPDVRGALRLLLTPELGMPVGGVRPLYGFIYSKVGNRAAAEDITSDVFVKALTHLDPTRAEHSCVAWLYRVARNAVHDYWRSGQEVPLIALEDTRPPPTSRPLVE